MVPAFSASNATSPAAAESGSTSMRHSLSVAATVEMPGVAVPSSWSPPQARTPAAASVAINTSANCFTLSFTTSPSRCLTLVSRRLWFGMVPSRGSGQAAEVGRQIVFISGCDADQLLAVVAETRPAAGTRHAPGDHGRGGDVLTGHSHRVRSMPSCPSVVRVHGGAGHVSSAPP